MPYKKLLQTQNSPEAALQLLTSAVMNDTQQLTVYQEVVLLLNIYEAQASLFTQVLMSFAQVCIIKHVIFYTYYSEQTSKIVLHFYA